MTCGVAGSDREDEGIYWTNPPLALFYVLNAHGVVWRVLVTGGERGFRLVRNGWKRTAQKQSRVHI